MSFKPYKLRFNFTEALLRDEYWNKGLSRAQIAKKYNYSEGAIMWYMKKFGIGVRDRGLIGHLRQVNHCTLSIKALEFIEGELLGDMHISARNRYSGKIVYSTKYKDYVTYLRGELASFGVRGGIIKNYATPGSRSYKVNKRNFTYLYTSLSYEELLGLRKRWYPRGKKIVPRDIVLTPLVCRQWYIGDGFYRKGKYRSIELATCSFSIEEIGLLISKLKALGFRASMHKNKIISISHTCSGAFLAYIGECPVKCYRYKWGVE